MSNTYTKESIFKGFPVFEIYKNGEEKPLISFGKRKAEAIVEHLDAIRIFAEEGGNRK